MKTRVVTALIWVAIFVVVVYLLPVWVTVLAFCALCALAAHELLGATGALKGHPLLWFSVAFAFFVPLFTCYGAQNALLAGIYVYAGTALIWAVFDYKRLGFSQVAEGVVGAFVIPYLLSSIVRIIFARPEVGRVLILLPFLAAWGSDTFAYLVGRLLGKRKLAPHVSPNKTVAGAVGGLVGAVLVLLLFGAAASQFLDLQFDYALLALAGAAGAAIGQCGDLAMSHIKRNFGIKDFGKLFPGHGGVLDRFDSVLFTAPFFEIMLAFTGIL